MNMNISAKKVFCNVQLFVVALLVVSLCWGWGSFGSICN